MSRKFKASAWACIVISAIAAMAISYSGLYGLAVTTGFIWQVAPLLPIAIDVAIVGATLVWLGQGAPREAFGFARGLALVAIGTSVLANATYHGLAGGERWWLPAAVASLPPAFLAALVHLGALLVRTGDTAEPLAPEAASPSPVPTPEPGDGLVTSEDATPAVASVEEQVRQILDDAERAGQPAPGRPTIARQLGASEHQVRQALNQLRQTND